MMQKSTARKIIIGVITTIAIVLLSCLLLGVKLLTSGGDELDKEIALAKSDGTLITDYKSFLPKTTRDQNAALLYEKAIPIVKDLKAPLTIDYTDPDSVKGLRAYLDKIKPAIDLVVRAVKLPNVAFEHNYDNVAWELSPEYPVMKNIARALSQRAELELRSGNSTAAIHDLTLAAKISHQVGQIPGMIGVLVSISIENMIDSELEIMLGRDPKLAKDSDKIVQALGGPPPIATAMHAEFTSAFQIVDRLRQGKLTAQQLHDVLGGGESETSDTNAGIKAIVSIPVVRNRACFGVVHTYRTFLKDFTPDKSPVQLLAITSAYESKQNESVGLDDILAFLMPVPGASVDAYARVITQRHLLHQAVAILESHQIPEQLPLNGENRIDAKNDQPLHYTKTAHGFKIYGLGRSFQDHGGVHRGTRINGKTVNLADCDTVFEYPYTPPPPLPKKTPKPGPKRPIA